MGICIRIGPKHSTAIRTGDKLRPGRQSRRFHNVAHSISHWFVWPRLEYIQVAMISLIANYGVKQNELRGC